MAAFPRLSALLLVPLIAACQPDATTTLTALPTTAPSPSSTRAPTAEPTGEPTDEPTITAEPEQAPLPDGAVFRVGGLEGYVGMDFAPDGSLLLVAHPQTGVTAYETAASFEQVWSYPLEVATSVAASPDGSKVAAIGFDGTLVLLDLRTGEPLAVDEGDGPNTMDQYLLAFSPDGSRLVTGSDQTGVLWLRNLETGHILNVLDTHRGYDVDTLQWYPDSSRILTGSWGGIAAVFDARMGAIELQLAGDEGIFNHGKPAVSPDGTRIATYYYIPGREAIKRFEMWDAGSGDNLYRVEWAGEVITALVFAPDSAQVVALMAGPGLALVDAQTGEPVRTAMSGDDTASFVIGAFSPDGRLFAAGDSTGSVYVWDAASWEALHHFQAHTTFALDLAWSPDSALLATGSPDGTVVVWDVPGD